ncbi:hypothetical protein PUNSTDRAFT_94862 [Punctularia strigosozonata HHB-11173 SS5]|uniref:uncharacterized protein n=1 Tax=Punctularia strigosozonata (strain HHB-11173) TaxID=741275 RepID=UPI000441701B|nr:uncharacterized protein PUNSTDRAFT_94862 [Punctularia strigosozonata HHB-11173 SS5]EIN13651.1 hypothetical protein PUNSTDRAFT_94862 [Punctularia strigosozonata HHB-11173 SS5]
MGVKREAGAEVEKNPLADVELSDEDAAKLQEVQKDIARAELILERQAQAKLLTTYEKRRAVVKAIPKFWPVALMNHPMIAIHAQHNTDQAALSYLEDVWMIRDPVETRAFTLEFHFKENPFFSDKVLTKEFKYVPPPAAANEKPDEEGITASMLDFSWERDVEPKARAYKINWKDDSKNLTKRYPRVTDDVEDDLPAEPGTFFNFFEIAEDPFDIGVQIANEVFPEAIDYFLGNMNDQDDSDDDEDDSDDDAEEIDLEKPRPKKTKTA